MFHIIVVVVTSVSVWVFHRLLLLLLRTRNRRTGQHGDKIRSITHYHCQLVSGKYAHIRRWKVFLVDQPGP